MGLFFNFAALPHFHQWGSNSSGWNSSPALPQSDSNLGVKTYLPLLFRINRAFLSNEFRWTSSALSYPWPLLTLCPLPCTFPSTSPRNPIHTCRVTSNIPFFMKVILNLHGWSYAYFLLCSHKFYSITDTFCTMLYPSFVNMFLSF